MYYTLFNLISTHIYGAEAVLTQYQELVLTQVATICSILLVFSPFIAVFLILRAVL